MSADQEVWRGLLLRIKSKLDQADPNHRTVYYSMDLDQYLDADNPVDNPTTTVRQEAIKLGVKRFVRLPWREDLKNYLELVKPSSEG